MDGKYEFINNEGGLPIKTFIHSVNFREIHWHKHVEILYVLKGSVGVRVGKELNILKENDLILINNSELHSTKKTNEDNIILSLQIDSNYFNKYIKNFSNMYFKCKSISEINEDSLDYDLIRVHIAKILWDVNKKSVNFGLDIIKETIEIISYLMQNCVDSTLSDNRTIFSDERLVKINSIINYIDENFDNGISLEDVAKQQDNSVYYVSHFIKDALGLSFQEYIDLKRLDKAIALIINTEKTITDIALESGFPSPKSLNRIIKREYGLTSKEFKEKNKIDNAIFEKKADKEDRYIGQSYMDFTEKVDYEKLYKYLDMPNVNKKEKEYKIYKTIKCDFPNKSKEYKKHWKELLTFGRASEGLRSEWKAQLREIQREIGFKYIRFHGIFSDDMMVYNVDEKGQVTYNWSYVDDLFDFFQEVNIKPFVELDFMPNDIKSGEEYFFWWRANITPPKEISLWTDMIKEFLKHCINRYGLEEVESWKFEVWNEPELEGIFWVGGMKAYFEFYASTVNAIKAISKKFYVGGPVITNLAVMQGTWLREFLKYCKNNNTPLDYISIHIYPYNFAEPEKVAEIYEGFYGGEDKNLLVSKYLNLKTAFLEESFVNDAIELTEKIVKEEYGNSLPINITEWNASVNSRTLTNDTAFMGTFIIKSILGTIDKVESLGYWTFTDIMEEFKAGISHFHGGFGLINKEGIKKSGYYGYYLLNKLGDEIIEQGDNYIITKSSKGIQILVYNFSYFDDIYRTGDTSALDFKNRYNVFLENSTLEVKIELKGLDGDYKLSRYALNRETGSAFDQWVKIGMPENMKKEEIEYLKGVSRPSLTIEEVKIRDIFEFKVSVPIHGVEMMVIDKLL